MLPLFLDIFAPSLSTMPCVSRLVNGSDNVREALVAHDALEETRIQQVQDGVLDAAGVLIDRHPVGLARSSSMAPSSLSGQA